MALAELRDGLGNFVANVALPDSIYQNNQPTPKIIQNAGLMYHITGEGIYTQVSWYNADTTTYNFVLE